MVLWGVAKAKVIPATSGPLGHGVGVTQGLLPGLGIRHFHPIADASQGHFELPARAKILQLRKHHRQLRFRNEFRRAVYKMQHGERLPPIPLPAEKPIAQLIIYGLLALIMLRQPVAHAGLGLGRGQAVQGSRNSRSCRLPVYASMDTSPPETTSTIGKSICFAKA